MGQKATKESRGKNIDPVRQFAAANGLVRKKQVAEALGITVEQARYAIETLVGQGHMRRVGLGSYEFVEQRRDSREAPLEDKIWRAMRVNPSFSSSDVAIQAGTTKSYFYKRLREYRAEGFVKPAGVRQVPGGTEKLWRLTGKGREHLERPRVVEFRADPLVMKVVNLNKLICTGRAQRYEEARHEAQRLAAEIIADLGSIRDRFVRAARGEDGTETLEADHGMGGMACTGAGVDVRGVRGSAGGRDRCDDPAGGRCGDADA